MKVRIQPANLKKLVDHAMDAMDDEIIEGTPENRGRRWALTRFLYACAINVESVELDEDDLDLLFMSSSCRIPK